MDEFVDPELGRMVAQPETLGCKGREYDDRRCPSVEGIVRDDNLLALEQQSERYAARAVLGWVLTVAGVLLCAAFVVGGGQ